jgi:hypothetical protein
LKPLFVPKSSDRNFTPFEKRPSPPCQREEIYSSLLNNLSDL